MRKNLIYILITIVCLLLLILILFEPIRAMINEYQFKKRLTREKLIDYESKLSIYDFMSDNHHFKKGLIKFEWENYIGAIQEFSEAINLNKNNSEYYFQRGNTIAYLGYKSDHTRGFKRALRDLDKAIKLNPNYGDAFEIRGYLKHKLNDLKGAMSDLTKSIKMNNSNSALGFDFRGRLKFDLEDFNGAIDDFDKSIELGRESYFSRGECYEKLNRYSAAISDYKKYTELKPNDGEGFFKLGSMYIFKYNLDMQGNSYNLGDKSAGCSFLSKSGELGYEKAFESIRKYCN